MKKPFLAGLMESEANLADLAAQSLLIRRGASYTRREKAEEGAASCSDDEEAENEAQEVMGATEEWCGLGCGIRAKNPGHRPNNRYFATARDDNCFQSPTTSEG